MTFGALNGNDQWMIKILLHVTSRKYILSNVNPGVALINQQGYQIC